MLNKIEPKQAVEKYCSISMVDNLSTILLSIDKKINEGERIILKEKVTKSAVYINIYKYDKFSWKYLLSDSIKVNEI